METGRRGTCWKRKGNFPQCHCVVSQRLQAWSFNRSLSLAFCSLLAIFFLLLLALHHQYLRMPKTGTYLMLFDIFEGPRSMALWSEKPKANKQPHRRVKVEACLYPSQKDPRGERQPQID